MAPSPGPAPSENHPLGRGFLWAGVSAAIALWWAQLRQLAQSWFAAAYPAAVSPSRELSPRCAHSIILLATIRRALCLSLPVGRNTHARSSATSMFAKVRESKLSVITAISFLPPPVSETLLRNITLLPGLRH